MVRKPEIDNWGTHRMSGVPSRGTGGRGRRGQEAGQGGSRGVDPDWEDRLLNDDDLWDPDELDDEPFPEDGDFWIDTDDDED